MCVLRGLTYEEEIGRRVAEAFDDVAAVVAKDIRTEVPNMDDVFLSLTGRELRE